MSAAPNPSFDGLLAWFERLTPQTLAQLEHWYAPQARFKDPFNDVTGQAVIRRIFEHMFESLDAPRFAIVHRAAQGSEAFATWRFDGRLRGRPFEIHGATHFRFDATGHVIEHRDYWDAAEEVYEKLPLLGAVLRRLRRRLGAA